MDTRRKDKFSASKKHFAKGKNKPRTKKDQDRPIPQRIDPPAIRLERKNTSKETLDILEKGSYEHNDTVVDISEPLSLCKEKTKLYYPKDSEALLLEIKEPRFDQEHPELVVVLEDCLVVAKNLIDEGLVPLVLNFASANNPGGGFRSGANAQEESITRRSTLFASIDGNDMYKENRSIRHGCLYTHHMILSPSVTVFRDVDDSLLGEDDVFNVDIISAPAVNAFQAKKKGNSYEVIRKEMNDRIARFLAVAEDSGANSIVAGAWGCGVFGNNIAEIAQMFYNHLTSSRFKNSFKKVVFAVLENSDYANLRIELKLGLE